MKKSKNRKAVSPLERIARESIAKETAEQNIYRLQRFAEKDFEGGINLNGVRLERLACVKALEGLARKHPKRKSIFLLPHHLLAASQYHGDLQRTQGHRSHAFRERIDVSSRSDVGLISRLDVSRRLRAISNLLEPSEMACIKRIISDRPDETMAQIWPNRTERNQARELIRSGLQRLAVYYGIVRF